MDGRWIQKIGSSLWVTPPLGLRLSRETEAEILLAAIEADQLFDSEVSGLAEVRVEGDLFEASSLFLPKQTCSGGETNMEIRSLEEFYDGLKAAGKNIQDFFLWWHSHASGDVYFSSKDERTIKAHMRILLNSEHLKFAAGVPDETVSGPFISLVVNARGEMFARCDFLLRKETEGKEFFSRIQIEDLLIVRNFPEPFDKLPNDDLEFLRASYELIKNEVREKVTVVRRSGIRR